MFIKGDKVLYPLYGTCIIEDIVKNQILGDMKLCYTISIPKERMQVSIPVDRADTLGIRYLVDSEVIETILTGFYAEKTDPVMFENQRYCSELNKKKIKSGDIFLEREIIRDLTRKRLFNKLGNDDTKMLNNACQVFISEMMEVKGLAHEEAVQILDDVIEKCS
ncbi:CarD family transcriptional regulator [Dehalobacter sp. DCM]|uniref:CarD family transcriptional regulator n=1 Tax=Dehalobacter sp. DCM TaxID=2907827 RepID=UPI003081D058|nr:CarD family transcriptional regulator [Dehalobacter sp. DCM]